MPKMIFVNLPVSDLERANAFYEKHGFAYAGEDKNPVSGLPVNRMAWRS